MSLRQISWALYLVGFGIVASSWIGLVSSSVGWLGWIIGMLGWAAQFLPGYRRETLADEIAKLEKLRSEGAITEEEFVIAKERLLKEKSGAS